MSVYVRIYDHRLMLRMYERTIENGRAVWYVRRKILRLHQQLFIIMIIIIVIIGISVTVSEVKQLHSLMLTLHRSQSIQIQQLRYRKHHRHHLQQQ